MPRRIARPYDKVYVVFDVVVDPFERLVDKREGRVAASGFGAVYASRAMFAVARCLLCGARISLVERVWMEVWMTMLAVTRLFCGSNKATLPVIWRNLPVSCLPPFAALLDPEPAVRLFPASATALGGAALACPQRSSPPISASRVRSMA